MLAIDADKHKCLVKFVLVLQVFKYTQLNEYLCFLALISLHLYISFLSNGFKEQGFFILSYVFSHKKHFVAISHCPTHVFIHREPLKDFCFLEPRDSIMCVQNDQKLSFRVTLFTCDLINEVNMTLNVKIVEQIFFVVLFLQRLHFNFESIQSCPISYLERIMLFKYGCHDKRQKTSLLDRDAY